MKYIFTLLMLIMICGCKNDNFSPYAELEKKVAVYCILDNRLGTQFVNVQKTYLPQNLGNNSSVTKVVLAEDYGQSFELRDTMMSGFNTHSMYYLSNYTLKRGIDYKLIAVVDSFWQQAIVSVPPVQKVSVVLKLDTLYSDKNGYTLKFAFKLYFPITIPNITSVQVYIDYEKNTGGTKQKYSFHVPIDGNFSNDTIIDNQVLEILPFNTWVWDPVRNDYPGIVQGGNSPYYLNNKTNYQMIYSIGSLLYTFNEIGKGSNPEDITFKRAYVVFYSIDYDFYENILAPKGTDYSVRLDMPFYESNFQNDNGSGLGYFAFVTADTSEFKMIKYFIDRFKYNDGQQY